MGSVFRPMNGDRKRISVDKYEINNIPLKSANIMTICAEPQAV